jgi:outer membrane protein assembly factor BamA
MCRFLILAAVACHPAGHAPTPAPLACRPDRSDRIGSVVVTGAERALVPSLTVLEGTADDPDRVQRIADTATLALHTRGYARATLAVTRAPCGLQVAVELGTRYRIAAIEFITSDAFPAAARLATLEDALGTVNAIGGVYVADRLADSLAQLQQRYRDAGWVEAEIGTPIATFVGAQISLRIPIRAGERFKIGEVRAVGAGARSRVAVLESLGLRGGDWYDSASIRSGLARVRRQLARTLALHTRISLDRRVVDVEVEVRK